MKKLSAIIIFYVFAAACFAYGYGYSYSSYKSNRSFIYTEENLQLVYASVCAEDKNGKADFSKILNVTVYDEKTKKTSYIFPKENKETITDFIFEKYINDEKESIVFNKALGFYFDFESVINNKNIPSAIISDNIIIETMNTDTKTVSVWLCCKNGSNLKSIYEYNIKTENVRLFIDPKNKKIIFVKQQNTQAQNTPVLQINSFEY